MGALFTLFNTNELKNFDLNWKDIEKSHPADASLYSECKKILQQCQDMQDSIDSYQGAKDEIKCAMEATANTDESKEAIRKAMIKVIPNAQLSQSWMQFAKSLSAFLVKRLLPRLSSPIIDNDTDKGNFSDDENDDDMNNDDDSKEANNDDDNEKISELTLLTHQALVREFALILDFLLKFDQTKMMKPQIQNDFSFYKRTMSKQNEDYLSDLEWPVSQEKVGFVSMFLAQSIVMMKEVAQNIGNNKKSLKCFAVFANACLDLLKENKFGKENNADTKLALRAMVSAFVIYDHANSEFGAFQKHKKSQTKAQKIIAMIVTNYANLYGKKKDNEGLINIIKFATANFSTAPASIKNLVNS